VGIAPRYQGGQSDYHRRVTSRGNDLCYLLEAATNPMEEEARRWTEHGCNPRRLERFPTAWGHHVWKNASLIDLLEHVPCC
jgi:hypothetical protein